MKADERPRRKLSRRQDALISALLLAPTLAEAAQTAGISEATAWRWLKDKALRTVYRKPAARSSDSGGTGATGL